MQPRYLTKSKFKLAIECPTKLYYAGRKEYYNNKSEDDWMQELARGGIQVGELAKQYFPGGIEIKCDNYWDHDQLIKLTDIQLQKDNVILYEAAIKHENCFIRVDILKKNGDIINFYEVKSKSFHPESDKNKHGKLFLTQSGNIDSKWKEYLYDVAFQNWVLEHSSQTKKYSIQPHLTLIDKSKNTTRDGLHSKFLVVKENNRWKACEIDKDYTKEELGEEILTGVPVSEYCEKIENDPLITGSQHKFSFQSLIEISSDYYKRDEKYDVNLTNICRKCEFILENNNKITDQKKSGFHECCTAHINGEFDFNEPNIFKIWNLHYMKLNNFITERKYYQKQLIESDIVKDGKSTVNDEGQWTANGRQWNQVLLSRDDKEGRKFNKIEFQNYYRKNITYPLHFIDFETSRVAIPFESGHRPYELYVFQYSIHIMKSKNEIDHYQWINTDTTFPNFDFIRNLKDQIGSKGTILSYSNYENTVLNTIHEQLEQYNEEVSDVDELKDWIESITYKKEKNNSDKYIRPPGIRCMVDLRDLCYWYYYNLDMKGSYSIKALLPAVIKSSDHLKKKYSKPLEFGTNLIGEVFWKFNDQTNEPYDPYDLLHPLFEETQYKEISDDIELLMEDEKIKLGGAAMAAYSLMQFTEMSDIEKAALKRGLLNYCELDTLAMVMIWEHWNSLCKN